MREDKRMGGYEKKEYNVYGRVGRGQNPNILPIISLCDIQK
jgi:hypothetical protein